METYNVLSQTSPIRDQICANLTLDDVLNLRLSLSDSSLDWSFCILGADRRVHEFTSLTQENIEAYRNLQRNLRLSWTESIRRGDIETLKFLSSVPEFSSFTVNHLDQHGNTGLMIAANRGYLEIVKLLLSQPGLNVNLQNCHGQTALMLASVEGPLNMVWDLLTCEVQPKINVNIQNEKGETALMYAVRANQPQIVELLLSSQDIDVNLQESQGYTALIYACRNNFIRIVELLLAHPGINVFIQNIHDMNALDMARFIGGTQILKILSHFTERTV